MSTRKGRLAALAAAAALSLAVVPASAQAQQVTLVETGSSLLYPLFNLWVPAFTQKNPDVRITTKSTGSGTGISEAVSGLATMGGSDAYLSDAMMKQHAGMLNIPVAISSQMVNYNLPGLNDQHLKLSGPVLAAIYAGKIKNWNDQQIARMNPGVKLPDHSIVTIHRTDSSGDTFIFTQFLAASTPDWQQSIGYGTTISWPSAASNAIGATGNQGMLSALKGNEYSVAYIGVSFETAIRQDKMGEAELQNQAGNFVLPTAETVQAAANGKVKETPEDERISLIFAPGEKAYPIINYEYVIVKAQQPNQGVAKALKSFLSWAVSPNGGNASRFLQAVNFVPLPESVVQLSSAQIAKIQ